MNNQFQDLQDVMSAIVHDMRNPLCCITGYAEQLLARPLQTPEQLQCVNRILSCGKWMQAMLDDLADSAALEQRALVLQKSPERVEDLLREAVELFELSARSRGVTLVLRSPEQPSVVLVDRHRFQRALGNIIANAIKHTPRGSGMVIVSATLAGGRVTFTVQDNGSGIAPEHLPRVFEKYYRASMDQPGLGLGLHIAKGILEAHGGTIRAESAGPGCGAALYLGLPRFDPEAQYAQYRACRGGPTPKPYTSAPNVPPQNGHSTTIWEKMMRFCSGR